MLEDLQNSFFLITNKHALDIEIKNKKLNEKSKSIYNKIVSLIDIDDILFILKLKHLINYIVINNITIIDKFYENIDNLLLYSRENTYDDSEIHEYKEIFNKIYIYIFDIT
jgi:hypothetical protein